MELTAEQVTAMRVSSLRLSSPGGSAAEIADWFAAMQAQDLASGKWSLGVRIPGATQADIDAALASGEILRTWPMRGTIHIVDARNAHWLLDLTGRRALLGLKARWDSLGLDRPTAEAAADVLAEALRGGRLTRRECLAALQQAGIDTSGGRAYHLLWHTAQIGVTCIGPNQGSEQTFVLLDQWAPRPRRPDRAEALVMLARRYFQSHGPATRADFQRWTGLTATDCKSAIAGADLARATFAGQEVFFLAGDTAPVPAMLLLPGFDEYLLGYKDRRPLLDPSHARRVVPGGNGMFRPTVVQHGRVIGLWRQKLLAKSVRITVTGFGSLATSARRAVEAPAADYAAYIGRDLDLRFD